MDVTRGLSDGEAWARLERSGPNEIRRAAPTPAWRVFLRQFQGALIWLLLAAAVLSAILGEVADALAISAILVVNAFVGFFQESRAERAVLALRSMTAPNSRVLRAGRTRIVPAREVVPGDILLLEAGDRVSADARLLEAHALTTNEAALTGESAPVAKRVAPTDPEAPLSERHDSVFLGTSVARGTATAEVTATGMATQLGRIAHLLESTAEETTPLQKRLARVGNLLLALCLGLVVVVAALALARGAAWFDVLLTSVSMAVAAVPEGLAALVTIALAIGVQRMAARNVLVRRLPAVEALGSTTVICTDKTGTLTTGAMAVRELWGADHDALLFAAAANCDAALSPDGAVGDPTEVAILRAASMRGLTREEIERARPRLEVHPFDPATRQMSTRRADGVLYAKGAVEVLVPRCAGGTAGAEQANAGMASRGLRVLAVAQGPDEPHLRLVGLLGIADPPRTEAIEAVARARAAGIRTVMITGDHPATAQAIAREMGIVRRGEDPSLVVHARATPEDKLRIVREWKARGDVVAMTGDGVNDAPALKEAQVGIAMGRTGTEVAREASDIVLADDNFASIVAAVQEGRGIYDNIQKTLVYLLAGNFAELMVMLGSSLLGMPLALLPLQLLWINLATDGLPALALVMDPASPDALERPPRLAAEPMLGSPQWLAVVATGLLQAGLALGVFAWGLARRTEGEARSLAFSVLVFGEVLRVFASRSARLLHWEVGVLSSWRLSLIVVLTLAVQIAIHYFPLTERLFEVEPFSPGDWALALSLGLIPVTLIEIAKLVRRLGSSSALHQA